MSILTRYLLIQYPNLPSQVKANQKEHFLSTGQNLARLREEKGMSQQELANLCSVDRAKISRIENGRADYMHSTLLEIANALDVDIRLIVAASK